METICNDLSFKGKICIVSFLNFLYSYVQNVCVIICKGVYMRLFSYCTVTYKPRWAGCNVLLHNNCEFECITHVTIIKSINHDTHRLLHRLALLGLDE